MHANATVKSTYNSRRKGVPLDFRKVVNNSVLSVGSLDYTPRALGRGPTAGLILSISPKDRSYLPTDVQPDWAQRGP